MNEASRQVLVPLPWQQELWLELSALALQQRLPHALLLAGPGGVGKRHFALALLAFVLCESRSGYACGTCRSCQQLAVGAQPNANWLSLDGLLGLAATADRRHPQALVHWQPPKENKRRDLTIDGARALMQRLALTSHYGQAKVALVDPADELNANAVNALLKTIEEPPAATHLILVTERPQGLPATLRSRCQQIRFSPPPRAAASVWLQAEGVAEAEEALDEASGAPLLAAQWARAGALAQRREWAQEWRAVAQRKRDPVSVAGAVAREELPQLLDWLLRWLATQLRQALGGAATAAAPDQLAHMIEHATEARRGLDGNANPQLLLEALLVEWARLTRSQIG
jgi:DNA polymerase-3 subunit delta'